MGEEAQEMIAALKKVSADVILNTAKEAAARILASERKATRLQYDLKVTKDDSLRIMLLLKQTINSKITEAENVSLSHRKRIEELEAQLNESEDTISGLRAELKEVHGKMDKMNNLYRNGCSQRVHAYERLKGKRSHTFKPFHRSMRRGKAFSKCRLLPSQQLLKQCPASEDELGKDQSCSAVETETRSLLDIFSEPISTGSSGDDSGLVDVVVMEEQGIEDSALVDVAITLENVASYNQNDVHNPLNVNSKSKAEQVMNFKQRDSFNPQRFPFSRKRSIYSTVGRSFAEIGKKMLKTGKENDPELTMSGLNPQSSRDNRRLVQIARQLVSLSGRS